MRCLSWTNYINPAIQIALHIRDSTPHILRRPRAGCRTGRRPFGEIPFLRTGGPAFLVLILLNSAPLSCYDLRLYAAALSAAVCGAAGSRAAGLCYCITV